MKSNRRILLTGTTGQVGWELCRTLAPLGTILAPDRNLLDLSRPEKIRAQVREWRPDLIVNPAAYTAVDQAESEHEIAFQINSDAPRVLAEEASKLSIPLVHYSTDYVFDGEKKTPYSEDDEPNPLNVYGESKLLGERHVQENTEQYLILRASWVYGLRGKNFLTTMLRLFQEREEIQVVDDQTGAPTWSRMVAEASAIILSQLINRGNDESRWGLYHLSASGQTSWFGFAEKILEEAQLGHLGGDLNGHLPKLVPIAASEYPLPAERPKFSLLFTEKIIRQFGVRLPGWNKQTELTGMGAEAC